MSVTASLTVVLYRTFTVLEGYNGEDERRNEYSEPLNGSIDDYAIKSGTLNETHRTFARLEGTVIFNEQTLTVASEKFGFANHFPPDSVVITLEKAMATQNEEALEVIRGSNCREVIQCAQSNGPTFYRRFCPDEGDTVMKRDVAQISTT